MLRDTSRSEAEGCREGTVLNLRPESSPGLLTTGESRIEGDQGDVLHEIYGGTFTTLRSYGMNEQQADAVATRALVRVQARLAQAGHVVRDVTSS